MKCILPPGGLGDIFHEQQTVILKISLICFEIRLSIMMICKESVTMTPKNFRDYLIRVLYIRMQTQ